MIWVSEKRIYRYHKTMTGGDNKATKKETKADMDRAIDAFLDGYKKEKIQYEKTLIAKTVKDQNDRQKPP